MKILITGASGYVGNALVEDLKGKHEVIATGRNTDRILYGDVEKLELDVSSPEQARMVIESVKPDVVIHAAALPKRSTADDDTFIHTNVSGAKNVAQAVRDYSNAKMILISSGCAFSQHQDAVISIDSEREMGTAFSKSKNLAEKAVVDVFAGQPEKLAIVYPPVILHESQVQGIIPYALQDGRSSGILTNKVPEGHVNFITHGKLAEFVEAIAADTRTEGVQRYPITGNRFTTPDFFAKIKTVIEDKIGTPCEVKSEADPKFETMRAMDESNIRRLKPDFTWGEIDATVGAILDQNLKKQAAAKNEGLKKQVEPRSSVSKAADGASSSPDRFRTP